MTRDLKVPETGKEAKQMHQEGLSPSTARSLSPSAGLNCPQRPRARCTLHTLCTHYYTLQRCDSGAGGVFPGSFGNAVWPFECFCCSCLLFLVSCVCFWSFWQTHTVDDGGIAVDAVDAAGRVLSRKFRLLGVSDQPAAPATPAAAKRHPRWTAAWNTARIGLNNSVYKVRKPTAN